MFAFNYVIFSSRSLSKKYKQRQQKIKQMTNFASGSMKKKDDDQKRRRTLRFMWEMCEAENIN